MKISIVTFCLIALSINSFFVESRPLSPFHDDESESFLNFDDIILFSSHLPGEEIIEYQSHPRHPKYPKYPKYPRHPGPKRAYVYFPSPPDIASGVMVLWETRNSTLIYGQFSKGFVEGDEKDYSFKIYKNENEIVDLKPEGESLDKIFTIKPNGSTELFLFSYNGTLITTDDVIGDDLVISRPDALIGKDTIKVLNC